MIKVDVTTKEDLRRPSWQIQPAHTGVNSAASLPKIIGSLGGEILWLAERERKILAGLIDQAAHTFDRMRDLIFELIDAMK
jgi:hypothetical protein